MRAILNGLPKVWILKFRELILKLLDYLKISETKILVSLSIVVGLASGLGAYLFRWLIGEFQDFFFGLGGSALFFLKGYYVILVPAIGGAIVGPLIYFFAREAKGHGVPEVMLAVAHYGGRIRPRVALVKALASSICIGSGGSVGREGPIVQIGSAIGSTIGQLLNVPSELIRTLVACGAAGGISATFNAPIAGVLFSLEVILRDFSTRAFSMVVLASVTAAAISRALMGNYPAFRVPSYSLKSPWELVIYLVFGIIAALIAKLFVKTLYRFEDVFDAWRFPEYLKPIAGGFLIGGIGLFFPHIFGVGYETIEAVLMGKMALSIIAVLVFIKILATSITIGSGGSGGIFAPSLFIGAMLGSVYGSMVNYLFPDITAPAGAYSLVGMGAVFAGAAEAPITSILILFEMTGDYRIILPLMVSSVTSALASHMINPETIYTLKLRRRGIDISQAKLSDILVQVKVKDVMSTNIKLATEHMTLEELAEFFKQYKYTSFPVVDSREKLVGFVGYAEIHDALLSNPSLDETRVKDIMKTQVPTAFTDENLSEVVAKFKAYNTGRIPVVSRLDRRKVVGVISHSDVLNYYYEFFQIRVSDRKH